MKKMFKRFWHWMDNCLIKYHVYDKYETNKNSLNITGLKEYSSYRFTVKAVRIALRCHVNRIIFGELRYGSTTNELLKAWNTGHRGGITTVHADNAILAIEKLRTYLREVIVGELPDVAQSVQLVIHMIPSKNGPIVNEIFETHQATQIVQSRSGQTTSTFIEELEVNGLI